MYARDRAASLRLPVGVLVILVIFILGLVLHYIAEEIPAAVSPGLDWVVQGAHAHPAHEHHQEHYISPFLSHVLVERSAFSMSSPVITDLFSFLVPPPPPPPNS